MSILNELHTIREIFNNFKNLDARYLLEEETIYAHKIDQIVTEIENKLKAIELIDEKIEELEEEICEKDSLELIDIELIRTRTQIKKVDKQIKKLESLNDSRIKLDVNERDKIRFRKNVTKLNMIKRLLKLSINKDGKAVIATGSGTFKTFHLNQNNTKEANTKVVWNNLMPCSPYIKEWDALFGKK